MRHCYLCNNIEFSQVDGVVRNRSKLKILKCNMCGLVFLESFKHINNSYYKNSNMLKGLDVEQYKLDCLEEATNRIVRHRFIYKNKEILDFGCGSGSFLELIRHSAKNVAGVEQNNYFKQQIEHKLKIKIYPSASKVTKKYDVITMFHVLEHLQNPIKVLNQLVSKLKKDGLILIEIPNIDDALITLYNCKAFKRFTFWGCHLFYYNEETLRKLIQLTNLKISSLEYVQRYPLSNHLYWLAKGKPGGHKIWKLFKDSINEPYEEALRWYKMSDTIIAILKKK